MGSVPMINGELSRVFERIADLMEIDGADGFRVNAYRKAARTIKDCAEDLATMAAANRLESLPGIGKKTAERIKQYLATGQVDVLTKLQAKLPEGLPALLEIQGLGPKKVAVLHNELNVGSMEELKTAISSGSVAELSGFGATSVKRISEGIEFLEKSSGRVPLGIALPLAEQIAALLSSVEGVGRVEIAGSLRRGKETIGDIDILCESGEGKDSLCQSVVEAFVQFEGVKSVLASGATKGSVRVALTDTEDVQVDLRVVPRESFGAALLYFTGSKEHNVRLRELAVRKKLRLNEYGLYEGKKAIAGASEEDIYRRLDVTWVPPELREDRGEFDADFCAEDLITVDDIRGDLHLHTVASDGKNTIEEMACAARARGYEYLVISDHSRSSTIANGLSLERMERHIQAIRAADQETTGIKILVGTECDILPDGRLDYPDELLARCDLVVASIHSAMGKGGSGKLSPTDRTLCAIANPNVTIIGHPTGRLLGRREAMDLDMPALIEAAAENGTVLEVNCGPRRLDLSAKHVRQALQAGVTLAINTDAHATSDFDRLRYGVMTARRGGARRSYVLNALPLAALQERIAVKRR